MFGVSNASAGLFGEHKQIGDEAFKRFASDPAVAALLRETLGMKVYGRDLALPSSLQGLTRRYDGVWALFQTETAGAPPGFTYGDMTGLSGDHSSDPLMLLQGLTDRSSLFLDSPPAKYATLVPQMIERLVEHLHALQQGLRSAENWQLDYIALSGEDQSHFLRAGLSFREHLQGIDRPMIELMRRYVAGLYETRDELIDSLFHANAISKYTLLHLLALEFFKQAGQDIDSDEPEARQAAVDNIRRGFLFNAFADHYLQDGFAAGHLVVVRSASRGFDNNGTHNYYNRIGLRVGNSAESWLTFGDNFYDTATVRLATDANVRSLRELWLQFQQARQQMRGHDPDADFPESLLDSLLREPPADLPAILVDRLVAFRALPIPFSRNALDTVARFANSRNGMFYGLLGGVGKRAGQEVGIALAGARFGLGYSFVAADSGDASAESKILFALEAGVVGIQEREERYVGGVVGMLKREDRWLQVTPGVGLILYDRLMLGAAAGWNLFGGSSGAMFVPSIGYELKPVTWSLAPSLRLAGHYSASFPFYVLQVELRYY